MFTIILASLLVMSVSLIGVVSVWSFAGKKIKKHIGLLVSFSAGVFLTLVIALIHEVLEHSDNNLQAIIWVVAGVILVWLFFKFIPHFHHHHGDECKEISHSNIDVRKILLSDALHNIGDGILLSASFAVSTTVGFAAAISILIHEAIQELSEFFVLREAGYSAKRALWLNFVTSATILIGAVGGFFLLDTFEAIEVPILALSAGAFLVVVLQDLIPASIRHSQKSHNKYAHILYFILGMGVMYLVSSIIGH